MTAETYGILTNEEVIAGDQGRKDNSYGPDGSYQVWAGVGTAGSLLYGIEAQNLPQLQLNGIPSVSTRVFLPVTLLRIYGRLCNIYFKKKVTTRRSGTPE